MKKSLFICALAALFLVPAQAQESKKEKKEAVKSHLKQHFKPYGFVRNYFTFDSRESYSGTGDMYNYQPKDENWNQAEGNELITGVQREDLNAVSTFRFLSLTTRLGLNITGYKWRGTEFGGKIEADFYAGLSTKGSGTHSLSGVAQFRPRQAYMTFGWDSLPMNKKDFARVDLTIGQTWHPMAADLCDVISLNSGAPFGPFNRSPQVKMDARLGKYVTLTTAALWQMQYLSTGPDGQSAEYIAYSKTPEAYLGLSFHDKGFLLRAGADFLSICPRHLGSVLAADGKTAITVTVKDRINTLSPFLYIQYKKGEFSIKAKSVFMESGEHMNMNGGYGVNKILADGSYYYTPTRTSTSWISIVYGGKVGAQEDKHPQKLQGILFGGYVHSVGTQEPLYDKDGSGRIESAEIKKYYFYPRATNMNQMWRLSPTLLYTVGKFQLGLEYEITSVRYGDLSKGLNPTTGLADMGLHWVTNHRVQLMTKYNF